MLGDDRQQRRTELVDLGGPDPPYPRELGDRPRPQLRDAGERRVDQDRVGRPVDLLRDVGAPLPQRLEEHRVVVAGELDNVGPHIFQQGDVLGVARIAGIMAAKKTPGIVPLCHPLNITSVEVTFEYGKKGDRIHIESRVRVNGQTGVEMEALTAVAAAALTIYDMCKAVDREIVISDILLIEKRGGKSGTFKR